MRKNAPFLIKNNYLRTFIFQKIENNNKNSLWQH